MAEQDDAIPGEFKEMPGSAGETRDPAARTLDRRVVLTAQPQELAQWTPQFEKAAVDRAIVQVQEKRRFFDEVMVSGSHYAIIPGQKPTQRVDQMTGQQMKDERGNPLTDPPKPALLKPGAELLLSAMGLHAELVDELVDEDWTGEKHGGEAFFRYRRRCKVWRQTGPGTEDRMLIAAASGECHSFEEKYRYRGQGGRTCPSCGMVGTVRRGSAQYAPREGGGRTGPVLEGYEGGGFYCWRKIDGCGAIFPDKDLRITDQEVAKEKHPNPADLTNTLLKMADKRALVAATLLATGCSDLFTQDIEDKAVAATPAASGTMSTITRPTSRSISEADQKLILNGYRFFQGITGDKNAKAQSKKDAQAVLARFAALMRGDNSAKREFNWTTLGRYGGPVVAEVFTILGIERSTSDVDREAEAAAQAPSAEEVRFDPDEVPA